MTAGARDPKAIGRLFESMPPHAVEAEMAVLGSILVDPSCVGDVSAILRGGDFWKPAHGTIFDAMVSVYDRTSALDLVVLNQHLADRDLLKAIGGVEYLTELAMSMPSASSVMHYARLVQDKSRVRTFIAALGDALYAAHNSPDAINETINAHQTAVFKLSIAGESERAQATLPQAMNAELESIAREMEGKGAVGIPTGFVELDELTGGLMAGEMIVLAARPSVGKSALMLNMAVHAAFVGKRVGMFSLEMSRELLVRRLLSSRAGVDAARIRNGNLSDAEYRQLMVACGDLQDATLFIDDTPGLNTTQLRARANRMMQRDKIDLLFIDYLQLLRGPQAKRENRQVEVSDISQAVKTIARELKIPVVVLAQLNRGPETEMRRPRSSDLRESGSIEQDADVVMLLHREDFMRKDDREWLNENPDMINVAELIVAKQRSGPTDVIRLTWCGQLTRFRDYTPHRTGVPAAPQHTQLQLAGAQNDDEDDLPI